MPLAEPVGPQRPAWIRPRSRVVRELWELASRESTPSEPVAVAGAEVSFVAPRRRGSHWGASGSPSPTVSAMRRCTDTPRRCGPVEWPEPKPSICSGCVSPTASSYRDGPMPGPKPCARWSRHGATPPARRRCTACRRRGGARRRATLRRRRNVPRAARRDGRRGPAPHRGGSGWRTRLAARRCRRALGGQAPPDDRLRPPSPVGVAPVVRQHGRRTQGRGRRDGGVVSSSSFPDVPDDDTALSVSGVRVTGLSSGEGLVERLRDSQGDNDTGGSRQAPAGHRAGVLHRDGPGPARRLHARRRAPAGMGWSRTRGYPGMVPA